MKKLVTLCNSKAHWCVFNIFSHLCILRDTAVLACIHNDYANTQMFNKYMLACEQLGIPLILQVLGHKPKYWTN